MFLLFRVHGEIKPFLKENMKVFSHKVMVNFSLLWPKCISQQQTLQTETLS